MAMPRSLCSICVYVSVMCVEIHEDQKRFLRGGDTGSCEPPDVGAAIQYALTLEAIESPLPSPARHTPPKFLNGAQNLFSFSVLMCSKSFRLRCHDVVEFSSLCGVGARSVLLVGYTAFSHYM